MFGIRLILCLALQFTLGVLDKKVSAVPCDTTVRVTVDFSYPCAVVLNNEALLEKPKHG